MTSTASSTSCGIPGENSEGEIVVTHAAGSGTVQISFGTRILRGPVGTDGTFTATGQAIVVALQLYGIQGRFTERGFAATFTLDTRLQNPVTGFHSIPCIITWSWAGTKIGAANTFP